MELSQKSELDLGPLQNGPHADLIRELARNCYADASIQAIWVGGSLAAGSGDAYSDVDFRIAVEPGHVDDWTNPDWLRYLPIASLGGSFLRFGEQVLLHHMVLADGTIVDFYVQDTTAEYIEPNVVVLACRDVPFCAKVAGFARPASTLAHRIDGAAATQFFVDYWITTHKERKALARKYDFSSFAGLYHERIALLRAWYMQATGKDIDSRVTIHTLTEMHKGLDGRLSEHQLSIVGMPTRTPVETVAAIDAVRAEMSRIGRGLAAEHGFAYPVELEQVVMRIWNGEKASLSKRSGRT